MQDKRKSLKILSMVVFIAMAVIGVAALIVGIILGLTFWKLYQDTGLEGVGFIQIMTTIMPFIFCLAGGLVLLGLAVKQLIKNFKNQIDLVAIQKTFLTTMSFINGVAMLVAIMLCFIHYSSNYVIASGICAVLAFAAEILLKQCHKKTATAKSNLTFAALAYGCTVISLIISFVIMTLTKEPWYLLLASAGVILLNTALFAGVIVLFKNTDIVTTVTIKDNGAPQDGLQDVNNDGQAEIPGVEESDDYED